MCQIGNFYNLPYYLLIPSMIQLNSIMLLSSIHSLQRLFHHEHSLHALMAMKESVAVK
jgi:hypothetical protein